jgi:hypothetical protein
MSPPKLPTNLLELTALALPATYMFKQATLSANSLEDTEYSDVQLIKFNCVPPYTSQQLPSHDQACLLDALHGYQLCKHRHYEESQLQ